MDRRLYINAEASVQEHGFGFDSISVQEQN